MSDAIKAPTNLSAALLNSGCYETTSAPSQIFADITELKQFDKMAEGKGTQWMITTFGSIFGMIFMLMIAAPTILLLVSVGFIAFCIWKWVSWSKLNLEDERYLVAERLIELFSRDQSENEPISVRIDFNKINIKINELRRVRDRTIYKSPWLSISGKFADGSTFALTIAQIMHVKFRKGKQKNKGFVLSLTTVFSRKKYGALQLVKDRAYRALQVTPKANIKYVKARGNILQIGTGLPFPLGLAFTPTESTEELSQLTTMMLLSAYEVLRSQSPPANSSAS